MSTCGHPHGLLDVVGSLVDCGSKAAHATGHGLATAGENLGGTIAAAADTSAHYVVHHYGTILSIGAGLACIVVTAGTCGVLIAVSTTAEVLQQFTNGTFTARSAAGAILLGAAAGATAGMGGILERFAGEAGVEGGPVFSLISRGLNTLAGGAFGIPAGVESGDICP